MKLALTMIVRDDREAGMFKRCLESFMPYMDGLYVSINGDGKTKEVEKIVKEFKGKFEKVNKEIAPELYSEVEGKTRFTSFAAARNRSWAMVDEPYDFLVWADVDDVVAGGEKLRTVAEKALEEGMDAVYFPYWYTVTTKEVNGETMLDQVITQHLRERLVKPGVFKWVSRLHEVTVPIDDKHAPRQSECKYSDMGVAWAHLAPRERTLDNLKRNAVILEIQAREENRKDPRTLFYLSKTYFDINDKVHDLLALELIKEYMEMSGWPEERANACEYAALIESRHGNHNGAIDWLFEGLKNFEGYPITYLRLAAEYIELNKIREAKHYWKIALTLNDSEASTTIGSPAVTKYLAATLGYNISYKEADLPGMLEWSGIRAKLQGDPEKDPIYNFVLETKENNDAAHNVLNFARYLYRKGEKEKIRELLKALPTILGREPFAFEIANQISEPKVWDKDTIVYYASGGGEHFEQWGPKAVKRGMGGSETAVYELTKRWIKMGFKVTVFGDPREETGTHEGVEWRPWYEINWRDKFNILILWRSPHLLDINTLRARRIYMDLHDVTSNFHYPPERMNKLDKIFFKTKYHRDMVDKLPDEKAVVISNGIDI